MRATTYATECGLISENHTVGVDGTGLESRHASRYFFKRAGYHHTSRLWTKMVIAIDTASHFVTGVTIATGPFCGSLVLSLVMGQASLLIDWDRVLADAAFDSESLQHFCRAILGIRSTVIPLDRRNTGRRHPKTRYRRQMAKRFRKKPKDRRYHCVYGQHWQVESAFSRHKRRHGSSLCAHSDQSRKCEVLLLVLTQHLMLLAAVC